MDMEKRARDLEVDVNAKERKKAEETLKKSEERFHAIFENSAMGIGLTDLEGRILNANHALLQMLGYTRKEILGKSIVEFIHPDDMDKARLSFRQLKEGEVASVRSERRYVRKSGEFLWANLIASLCRDNMGRPEFAIGLIEDVTERKRAEQALIVSEERFRQRSEATFEGIVIHDQGKILDVNQQYADMFGYSVSEIIGKSILEFVAPDHRETVSRRTHEGFEAMYETWGVKKDGTTFPLEIMAKNSSFKGKTVRIGALRDITRLKEAEEGIKRGEREAKKLAHESAVMAEIGRIISSTLDIDEIYERFAEEVRKLIPFDRIASSIVDEEKNTLRIVYVAGCSIPERQSGDILPLEGTVTNVVLRARKGFLIQREDESELTRQYPSLLLWFKAGLQSMMIVPLICNNKAIGILSFQSRKPRAYTGVDLTIAQSISNQIVGAIANALLFKEYKLAEERLRNSEKRYRAVVESQTELVNRWLPDGTLTFVNEACCRYFGKKREELVGHAFLPFIPDDDAAKVKQHIASINKENPVGTIQLCVLAPNGEVRWQQWTNRGIFDDQGQVIEFQSSGYDITKRKQAEELLQKERETFFTILKHAPYGVILVDSNGNFLYTNPEFVGITGYSTDEIQCGRDWIQKVFSDEESRKTAKETWKEGRSHGGFASRELDIICKNGKRKTIEFGATFLTDGTAVTMLQDVTEIRRAEAELKSSHQQLRAFAAHLQSALENERTRIAREIHDELGQALTAIKMDVSWMSRKLPRDQTMLLDKTLSLSELLDSTIKTVKRIMSELRPGLLDDLGLAAAMEWQVEEFQNRTGIKCEVTVTPEEIVLSGDLTTAIFRIFQEALTNVTRHAKATKVWVNLMRTDGRVEVSVRDNGRGIKQKKKKKKISIPEGFGLIGIQERVRAYGGEVEIKSKPGKGTKVLARIPLAGK